MDPLFVGHPAPCFVSWFAWKGDGTATPDLFTGSGIVCDHDTSFRPTLWAATPTGNHLAVGNNRAGTVASWIHLVIKNLGFPNDLSRCCIEADGKIVVGGIDNKSVIDCDVSIGARVPTDHLVDVFWKVSPIGPFQVTRDGIDCLDHII